ncbi:amiloride-sensitive sodium channel subunit beta-like [Hydractinia symbiolongicarpus]|uniref:amiloride-sensitive sodium channel subunit beta-like n=1 Tax=Hydractinia symbiolongicarpus TaxID=13093 RepID=UPI00254A8052|nr:amiloride-sensitive sodium channel subunit beta-like [Hydractinia symbiolongicarpus]
MAVKINSERASRMEEENKSLKTIWLHFATNTTAHRFSQIVLTGSAVIKIFWLLTIFACQVGMFYQVEPLVKRYFIRPTQTKIYLREETNPVFPAITICNTINVKKGTLAEELWNGMASNSYNFMAFVGDTSDGSLTPGREQLKRYFEHLAAYEYLAQKHFELGAGMYQYGHHFKDMIASCEWKSIYDCKNETYWKQFWHWKHGNCFMFNSGYRNAGEEVLKVSDTGIGSGLSIKLNIEIAKYSFLANVAGIVMQVGEQGAMVDLTSRGTYLAPGFTHVVALKKTRRIRADPFENKSCGHHHKADLGKVSHGPRLLRKYSKQLCKKVCYSRNVIKRCGCVLYQLPSLDGNKTCSKAERKCLRPLAAAFKAGNLTCLKKCSLPCLENSHEIKLTSSKLYARNISMVADNLLEIIVSFEDFETSIIEDEEYYRIENLLSDIGGQFGLWSGISVLTLIEFLVFIIYALFLCVSYIYGKLKNK